MAKSLRLFVIGCLLIVFGSYLAHKVQTTNGVVVQDVRFPGEGGLTMSGLLYTPKTATAAHPAPAVLVSHGFINTREMQSPFAIELSRRGFVVLAMDMSGHGYSGGYLGQYNHGGPAALRYLQSLPFVDKTNIGLVRFYAQQATGALDGLLRTARANEDRMGHLSLEGDFLNDTAAIS